MTSHWPMAIDAGLGYHALTVLPILVFKLAVLAAGCYIARLGHNLLIRGVSGEFKFQGGFKGATADLVSASPGLFFILMATILIAVGVVKDKPFGTKAETATESVDSRGESNPEKPALLPDSSLKEEGK